MSTNVTAVNPLLIWLMAASSTAFQVHLASAQFGYQNQLSLPESDFVWTWGNGRSSSRTVEDFSVLGSDSGFRCDLRGKLRAGGMGSVSKLEIRDFESELRGQMRFISAASNKMNELEAQGALEWATLQCEKPKREE
jgi:hypothetical protein